MWEELAANFETIYFVEIIVSLNGSKLEYLIKIMISSSSFRIVEDHCHRLTPYATSALVPKLIKIVSDNPDVV